MRLEKGWLDKANRCPSPNYDVRSNEEIDLIVIHSISLPPGIFGNTFVEDFFQNKLDHSKDKYFQEIKDLKVSSHFLIKREGEITQFVSILDRASDVQANRALPKEEKIVMITQLELSLRVLMLIFLRRINTNPWYLLQAP